MAEEVKTDTPAGPMTDATVLEDRAKDFVKEYGELVAKHNMDFATYPMFVPDGSGGFKVTIQNTPVDITNQPKKSPFVAQ